MKQDQSSQRRLGLRTRAAAAILLAAIARSTCADEPNFEVIKSFGYPEHSAIRPEPMLLEGSDGMLYGVTVYGGGSPASSFYRSAGTVFKLSKDGRAYVILHHFSGTDGENPQERLIEASDGKLYGATGEAGDRGTLFRLERDGSQFEVIHHFSDSEDGRGPIYSVTEGTDGMLYGRTLYGGQSDSGTVFRLAKDGTDYTILYHFQGFPMSASAPLVRGSDGHIYGTATGGAFGLGVVFRIRQQDGNFEVVYAFRSLSCLYPRLSCETTDGALYGVGFSFDGTNNGCVFKLIKDGSAFTIVKNFIPTGVSEGHDGYLYGTTFAGTVFRMDKEGQNFSVLHQFDAGANEGFYPGSPVIQGDDGNLYGTTIAGVGPPVGYGNGVVYTLKGKKAQFRVLHFFSRTAGDVISPTKVIEGRDGLLYGSARGGGGSNSVGTIFRMHKDGTQYDQVFEFAGPSGNSQAPVRQLLQGGDGVLYGIMRRSVFRIRRNGKKFEALHNFDPSTDGWVPAILIEGFNETLYGVTEIAGPLGGGTVFQLRKDGNQFVVLHSFEGRNEDSGPKSLLFGIDGYLYGITRRSLFRLRMDGSDYLVVHRFGILVGDGLQPGALVQASDGALYGATSGGGDFNYGTIFRVNPDGSRFTTLFHFDRPGAPTDLVEASDGVLYGTAYISGLEFGGRVFGIDKDGSNYAVLREFARGERGPEGPIGVIEGSDGALYVTTEYGGQMNFGTVCRLLRLP